jgi:Sec-independent protein translocase protein TatA
MDILGVGGWELVAIVLIMLIVAGPKRMIGWSYTLGRYVGMARDMWAQTARQLEKELKDSGVDVELPKDIPTKLTLSSSIAKAVTSVSKPLSDPLKQPLDEIQKDLNTLRQPVTPGDPTAFRESKSTAKANGVPAPEPAAPSSNGDNAAPPATDFGSWSG